MTRTNPSMSKYFSDNVLSCYRALNLAALDLRGLFTCLVSHLCCHSSK